MKYLITLVIAAVLIGALNFYVNQRARSLQERLRQMQADRKPPNESLPNLDADHQGKEDHGMEVRDVDLLEIQLIDSWFAYRIVLIPFLILGSLALARIFGSAPDLRKEQPTSEPAQRK